MSNLTNEQEMIHELKGNIEALTALLLAIGETMTDEQRDRLPKAFYAHVEQMRENELGSDSMEEGFEDRFSKLKTTLLFPDTCGALPLQRR